MGPDTPFFRYAIRVDARLLAVRTRTRRLVLTLTVLAMIWVSIPHVPGQYADYSGLPVLHVVQQKETYGPDTISDMYAAKVILNDIRDMYTKRKLEQSPLEARTWSKEESGPYPPVVLLTEAGLYAFGAWTGIGFYGMILGLAALFLGLSLAYFVKTRWYLFPVLYLNFSYLAFRFVYVQDSTYLIMLVVVMAALFLARRRSGTSHVLMAVAITMKLSPVYYVKNVLSMKPRTAVLFVAVLLAGFVLPYFIWENYLYIYRFHNEFKGGHWYNTAGALALVIPFTLLLWYVETRRDFDREDRVGWSLVPFAMFVAIKMNAARHLILPLLVPDKRASRNVAVAVGLGLHTLFPSVIRLGSVVYIASALLTIALIYQLARIGWPTVRDDLRHPGRTARMMLGLC